MVKLTSFKSKYRREMDKTNGRNSKLKNDHASNLVAIK